VLAVVAAALLGPAPTVAAATRAVSLSASLNGTNLAHATEAHPVHITPGKSLLVALRLQNSTAAPVPIGSVDLNGRVAGLTFFSFQTSVSFDVPPGQSKSLAYVLDTTGLKGQATGLVPSSLDVSEPSGHLVASQAFVSDVNGSLISVYGLFGLGILVLTVLALIEVLLALAHGRLPVNRWRRGIRFMVPSLGIGGVLVFTLSAFGKWLPSNGHWLTILAIFGVVGFAVGYLTPTPLVPGEEAEGDDEDEETDDEDQEEIGTPIVTPTSIREIQA
jgi:hypothetical protein